MPAVLLMLLLVGCFAQPVSAQPAGSSLEGGAATIEELANGLGTVCDLTVDGASGDPLAVVWAEAAPPRVVRWSETDRQPHELLGALPTAAVEPIRLLFTAPGKLLVSATVAGEKPVVRSVPCPASTDPAVSKLDFDNEKLPTPQPLVALIHDGRYVFACAESGGVYRSRMVAGNFGMIKPLRISLPLQPVALGLSERGFLAIVSSDSKECPIDFFNPDQPGEAPALRVSTKLAKVVDLAYGAVPRPHSRQLYVLNGGAASEGGGLYRIDAAINNGRMDCSPVRIVAIDRPRTMAFAAFGGLIVATEGETPGSGRLLRVEGDL